MATPQVPYSSALALFNPECEAPGCYVVGDEFTMVHCRGCGGWFCPDHVDAKEGVTLVHLAPQVLRGLGYYQGICLTCQQGQA